MVSELKRVLFTAKKTALRVNALQCLSELAKETPHKLIDTFDMCMFTIVVTIVVFVGDLLSFFLLS